MQLTPGKAFSIVFVAFLVVVVVGRRCCWSSSDTLDTSDTSGTSAIIPSSPSPPPPPPSASSVVAVVAAVVVAVFVCYGSSYSVTVSAAILQQSVCKELATRECITHTHSGRSFVKFLCNAAEKNLPHE